MRCAKCGSKVKIDSTFCTRCGNRIEKEVAHASDNRQLALSFKHKKIIVIVLIGVCFIGYFFFARCTLGLCLLPREINGEYCSLHTCNINGCANKKATDSNYCYTHSPVTFSGLTYTPESAESVLNFSNVNITHNSSYTVCTATIKNNGRKTYSFVEVKGKFKNAYGVVLNTDWTFAVGAEGLAPGESTSFRLSVEKDWSIESCSFEILDYNKE